MEDGVRFLKPLIPRCLCGALVLHDKKRAHADEERNVLKVMLKKH